MAGAEETARDGRGGMETAGRAAFDASFSREQLAAFVLDSLLGQMSRGADNCEGLEQVLRRLLYR